MKVIVKLKRIDGSKLPPMRGKKFKAFEQLVQMAFEYAFLNELLRASKKRAKR